MADFQYELLKGVPCIKALIEGRQLRFVGRFIIDTGAYMTILRTPRIDAMGYSAQDATRRISAESVIGKEQGYCIKIKAFNVFGKSFQDFEVAALDLPPQYHIDGLIGMNLLSQFDWCLFPGKNIISVK